jgi:minor fimbrial subunit
MEMIMSNKIKCGVIALAIFSGMVSAADVTINVSGKVIASPCTVETASNISVDLGQNLQAADLNASGKYSAWVPISLKVKNCPTSTSNVVATFSGTADTAAATRLYKNTGGASNLAVELQQAVSPYKALGNNQTLTVARAADNTAEFKLQARAWATGAASTGTIASVVSATFTYN